VARWVHLEIPARKGNTVLARGAGGHDLIALSRDGPVGWIDEHNDPVLPARRVALRPNDSLDIATVVEGEPVVWVGDQDATHPCGRTHSEHWMGLK